MDGPMRGGGNEKADQDRVKDKTIQLKTRQTKKNGMGGKGDLSSPAKLRENRVRSLLVDHERSSRKGKEGKLKIRVEIAVTPCSTKKKKTLK